MTAFYSEHDPYAAQYLRNLIALGLIAPGVVDERDLQDIEPYELLGFTQVHLCAGIGIWSGALRAAGWPDHEPIWTGSFPCQPFSQAGKRKGTQDERHLWPVGLNLIAQCRPPRFAGEQVASKDGREWLDTVSADLEALGFAFGASDLCAAGFQQAHIRQRNYSAGLADFMQSGRPEGWAGARNGSPTSSSSTSGLANGIGRRQPWTGGSRFIEEFRTAECGSIGGMGNPDTKSAGRHCGAVCGAINREDGEFRSDDAQPPSSFSGLVQSDDDGCEKRELTSPSARHGNSSDTASPVDGSRSILHPGKIASRWYDVDWLLCRNPAGEPSWRPVEPGTFPLAHGVPARMGKLRAYGNALDWQTAKAFCEVLVEICDVGF